MASSDERNLDIKINLLNGCNQKQEFLKQLKKVLEDLKLFDLPTTENRILQKVLPSIINRFNMVYNENFTLFETLDEEILFGVVLIKENLEVAFELTENLQEILNFIYQHNPHNAGDIESVLKYIPNCVLLFADHWNKSSETYKDTFNAELSKLLEVIKHLYVTFLYLVEFSVSINDSDEGVLVAGLISICELTKKLHYNLDESGGLVICKSWKCFCTVATKYSTAFETGMDLRIPIAALCKDISKMSVRIINEEVEALPRHLQMINFLIKILFKITDIFYEHLDIFGLDLLIFFVKISSIDFKKIDERSAEAPTALDTDLFKGLDAFLQRLIMGQRDFKKHVEKIPDYIESIDVFKQHPLGIINLSSKILYLVATIRSDWGLITSKLIEVIFVTLLCNKELRSKRCAGELYQQLILNMSASILLQDVGFQSSEILLRHILQDDAFVAVLALEIYTLVISNVHPDESLTLFINLLYGVNDILCGFFTSRPEMVYLKKLLQRIFKILPDALKEEIIKLFNPGQCIQIWRFLGFNSLPKELVQPIIDPVVNNTSECIRSILDSCPEDIPVNIAEGLNLISTLENLDINNPRFGEITKFLHTFWTSDFNCNDILDNNIMKYFIMRTTEVTAYCIQNSILDWKIVSTNLETLSCKESYWISIYKMIYSILNSATLTTIAECNKRRIFTHIAHILNLAIQNKSNPLLQETYLEMFRSLNQSQKDILNVLLDSLNPNVAGQIFVYLGKSSTGPPFTTINNYSCFNHKCLNWKTSYSEDATIMPQIKRSKMEVPLSQPVNTLKSKELLPRQFPKKTLKIVNKENSSDQKRKFDTFNVHEAEDDSSATEVITRIKGEVKCLIKVCKTEKLTPKNVADLRIIMGQVSSLM